MLVNSCKSHLLAEEENKTTEEDEGQDKEIKTQYLY